LLWPAAVDPAGRVNGGGEVGGVASAIDFCLTAPAGDGAGAEAEYLAPHPSRWLEVGEGETGWT
ncbi:MAG: hypothetical protein ACK41W_06015, partial [Cyanobacteriota bacterium]